LSICFVKELWISPGKLNDKNTNFETLDLDDFSFGIFGNHFGAKHFFNKKLKYRISGRDFNSKLQMV
jgi:hypothetical protein